MGNNKIELSEVPAEESVKFATSKDIEDALSDAFGKSFNGDEVKIKYNSRNDFELYQQLKEGINSQDVKGSQIDESDESLKDFVTKHAKPFNISDSVSLAVKATVMGKAAEYIADRDSSANTERKLDNMMSNVEGVLGLGFKGSHNLDENTTIKYSGGCSAGNILDLKHGLEGLDSGCVVKAGIEF